MSRETNEKLRALPQKIVGQQAMPKLFNICQIFSQIFQQEVNGKDLENPILFGWPMRILTSAFCAKI
jgi:hypothetical protein